MGIEEILQMITNVGFPIACVLIIGYLFLKEQEMHKEETNSLKEAIQGNTLVMTELKQLISDMREGK